MAIHHDSNMPMTASALRFEDSHLWIRHLLQMRRKKPDFIGSFYCRYHPALQLHRSGGGSPTIGRAFGGSPIEPNWVCGADRLDLVGRQHDAHRLRSATGLAVPDGVCSTAGHIESRSY